MTRHEKLVQTLLSKPNDFTWEELVRLLEGFGFDLQKSGKTGGSRRRFYRRGFPPIDLHQPHPRKILRMYQIKDIITYLRNVGLIK